MSHHKHLFDHVCCTLESFRSYILKPRAHLIIGNFFRLHVVIVHYIKTALDFKQARTCNAFATLYSYRAMCDLGSTVDPKAIARMLHTDCDHHHCRGHVSSAIEVDQASKHAPTDPTSIIPDFLHCGAWPAADPSTPVTNGDDFLQSTKSSQATEGYASPQHSILPGIDEDSESEGGSSDSDHEVQVRPVRPVTATWEGLSAAVNTWKINDDGSKLEGEVEKCRHSLCSSYVPPMSNCTDWLTLAGWTFQPERRIRFSSF